MVFLSSSIQKYLMVGQHKAALSAPALPLLDEVTAHMAEQTHQTRTSCPNSGNFLFTWKLDSLLGQDQATNWTG
jgi:hypothetical protein